MSMLWFEWNRYLRPAQSLAQILWDYTLEVGSAVVVVIAVHDDCDATNFELSHVIYLKAT